MKRYSYSLRARFLNYSFIHAVCKKARKSRVSQLLSLAALVAPALTNAGPEELAKAKNCFSCHKVEGQRIGPSYVDVAKKYSQDKNAHARIIKQIQEGDDHQPDEITLPPQPLVGTLSGFPTGHLWHSITMPPQPQVSAEEAKQLANWILSLNKKKERK